jgi:hypothetical protein
LIGLPFTIPVGLLPVIPNIPGLYLAFRAWSHFKGQSESYYKSFLSSNARRGLSRQRGVETIL